VRIIVPAGQTCASACAFAALAGRDLMIDGEMLFHRPFTSSVPADATLEDVAARYGAAFMDMAEYLIEVGRDISLARRIVTDTGRCAWLVADADSSLDQMRVEGRCDEVRDMRPVTRPGSNFGVQ